MTDTRIQVSKLSARSSQDAIQFVADLILSGKGEALSCSLLSLFTAS